MSSEPNQKLSFIRGDEDLLKEKHESWEDSQKIIRAHFTDALSAQNVAFLLGAGCSSHQTSEGEQVGIHTMKPLAQEFLSERGSHISAEDKLVLQKFGIDLVAPNYEHNLENLMGTLFSVRRVLFNSSKDEHADLLPKINQFIMKVRSFLLKECTKDILFQNDSPVLETYKKFYRKLILRDRNLPKPWIFTTNYDLFNETAMDSLGLPYCNGFSGLVDRVFNPAVFRYALAEQLDVSSKKWAVVDGFVYLCKLHGSVNWVEEGDGLFKIKEKQPEQHQFAEKQVMIYPTPAKQNSSLGTPYSDLFREFHSRVVRNHSVLFTIGYSFSDEHINNIIYQALTIPNFRLIILASLETEGDIQKIRNLKDPRVCIVGGGFQPDNKDQTKKGDYNFFLPQKNK